MKKTLIAVALLSSMLLLNACGSVTETESSAQENTTEAATALSDEETTGEAGTEEEPEEETAEETEEETEEVTEEAPAEETEAITAEMNGAPDADFVSIAGDWYIDGDPTLASLHIEPDGTFKTYYASGNLESAGTIRYEPEEIEDTTHYHYNLYNNDGEFVMSFLDDGSSVKTDLYVGNGGVPHYQKLGEGGILDDGRGPGEEFIGTWGCGRATLEITQLSDTEFQALIWWADSAFAHVEWDYPLTYQDGKLICDGKCTKTYIEYTSADADPDETVEYTDGSGEFVMQGAGIVWNDLTEHSGDDMVFLNSMPEE